MFTEQIAKSSVFTIIKYSNQPRYGIELPSWDWLKTNIMCPTEPDPNTSSKMVQCNTFKINWYIEQIQCSPWVSIQVIGP